MINLTPQQRSFIRRFRATNYQVDDLKINKLPLQPRYFLKPLHQPFCDCCCLGQQPCQQYKKRLQFQQFLKTLRRSLQLTNVNATKTINNFISYGPTPKYKYYGERSLGHLDDDSNNTIRGAKSHHPNLNVTSRIRQFNSQSLIHQFNKTNNNNNNKRTKRVRFGVFRREPSIKVGSSLNSQHLNNNTSSLDSPPSIKSILSKNRIVNLSSQQDLSSSLSDTIDHKEILRLKQKLIDMYNSSQHQLSNIMASSSSNLISRQEKKSQTKLLFNQTTEINKRSPKRNQSWSKSIKQIPHHKQLNTEFHLYSITDLNKRPLDYYQQQDQAKQKQSSLRLKCIQTVNRLIALQLKLSQGMLPKLLQQFQLDYQQKSSAFLTLKLKLLNDLQYATHPLLQQLINLQSKLINMVDCQEKINNIMFPKFHIKKYNTEENSSSQRGGESQTPVSLKNQLEQELTERVGGGSKKKKKTKKKHKKTQESSIITNNNSVISNNVNLDNSVISSNRKKLNSRSRIPTKREYTIQKLEEQPQKQQPRHEIWQRIQQTKRQAILQFEILKKQLQSLFKKELLSKVGDLTSMSIQNVKQILSCFFEAHPQQSDLKAQFMQHLKQIDLIKSKLQRIQYIQLELGNKGEQSQDLESFLLKEFKSKQKFIKVPQFLQQDPGDLFNMMHNGPMDVLRQIIPTNQMIYKEKAFFYREETNTTKEFYLSGLQKIAQKQQHRNFMQRRLRDRVKVQPIFIK